MNSRKKLLVTIIAAALLLSLAGAAVAAATVGRQPVTPDQFAVPEWVAPEDAAAYVEGYRQDYEAYMSHSPETFAPGRQPNQLEEPDLLFVAPEDRDEAIAKVMRGEELKLQKRADGFQTLLP